MKTVSGSMTTDQKTSLIRNALALVPVLSERALPAEQNRRLPDLTVHDLLERELLSIVRPRRFNGHELDIDTQMQVSAALARGCVSTGWCHTVWGVHAWLLAHFEEPAQRDVWGENPDALVCASLRPTGKAKSRPDGITLSGQWGFASGCDHAEWAILGVLVMDPADGLPPGLRFALVPREAYEIVDTWFATGLAGTGSKDLKVEESFVPRHRMISIALATSGQSPGLDVNRAPLFRNPFHGVLASVLASAPLGAAQAAITWFQEHMKSRVLVSGLVQRNMGGAQIRLSESAVEVDAAELLLRRVCQNLAHYGERPVAPLDVRARMRRDTAFAVKLCARAVDRLYEISGGRALQQDTLMQRLWRDVHAGRSHATLNWDTAAENFGRIAMDLEPNMPFV